jgi:DNA invertase Pin-like site-specific DNA recombinase
MPKAYSYKRFSSEQQATGDSLRRQTELAERYVLNHPGLDLELDTKMDMTDSGLSAYKSLHLKKGALGVFSRAVEDGQIDEGSYLLVESIDRLYRSQPAEALPMLLSLVSSGINVVTLNDEKVFSKETLKGVDGTFVIMQSLVSMARAYDESRTKGMRVKAAWENKFNEIAAGKQLTKRVPFWLTQDRKLIPERSQLVSRIFEMYSRGIGTYNIARTLNAEKIEPPTKRADHWATSTVNKLLRSKNAMGTLVTADGAEHRDYFPPVISEDLWLECHKLKRSSRNATGKSGTALLSGLCRCAECGGSARKTIKTGRIRKDGTRGRWETLVCSRAANNAGGCPYIGIRYAKIVDSVLSLASQLQYEHPEDVMLKEITNLRFYIDFHLDKLNDAYEISKKTKTVDARERYRKIAQEHEKLKESLRQLESQSGARSLAGQDRILTEIFTNNKVTNSNLRKLLKNVVVDFRTREIKIQTHLGNEISSIVDEDLNLGDAI